MTSNKEKNTARLWREYLSHAGRKFDRDAVIGGYVMPFYCPVSHLAVEVGDEGEGAEGYRRREYLKSKGIRLLRFSSADVEQMFPDVCRLIENAILEP